MRWEEFTFGYLLGQKGLFGDFVSIEAYKEASSTLILAPDWSKELDKLNRIRAVHGTTALEGNPLSEAEVAHQIEGLDEAHGQPVHDSDCLAVAGQAG